MALSRNGHPDHPGYGHWIVMYWRWNFGGAYVFVWKCWVYSQWNSHLIGIMISKTIGFRDTLFSDIPICNHKSGFWTNPCNQIVASPSIRWIPEKVEFDMAKDGCRGTLKIWVCLKMGTPIKPQFQCTIWWLYKYERYDIWGFPVFRQSWNIYRTPQYLGVKPTVSCRFSLSFQSIENLLGPIKSHDSIYFTIISPYIPMISPWYPWRICDLPRWILSFPAGPSLDGPEVLVVALEPWTTWTTPLLMGYIGRLSMIGIGKYLPTMIIMINAYYMHLYANNMGVYTHNWGVIGNHCKPTQRVFAGMGKVFFFKS